MLPGRVDVAALVVEVEIRLERLQERPLVETAEEQRLVDGDVPLYQRTDRALVRGGAPGRDQGRADFHGGILLALQAVQCLQQRLERARRQRLQRMVGLMLRKGFQAVALVD